MAKTTFVLEADQAAAVNAFLKVVDAESKTVDGMKKITRQADEARNSLIGIKDAAAAFGVAMGAVEGVQAAVKLLVEEFEDLKRKEKEAAQTTIDYAKNFSQNIGRWLGAGMIDQAHAALTGLTKEIPNLSYTTGQAILSAYAESNPRASLSRGTEAIRFAAPLMYDQVETAKLAGELENIMPDKSMDDLFDIAVKLQHRAGKHRAEIEPGMRAVNQLIGVGIPREKALATLMAALESEQAGKSVMRMASLPLELKEPVKRTPGHILTEEKKIRRDTQGMTEAQIYDWMLANPAKVKKYTGTGWASIAPIMKPGAIQEWEGEIQRAQTEDEYQKELEAQRKSNLAKISLADTEYQANIERLKMGYGPGARRGLTRKAVEETLKSVPEVGSTQRNIILKAIEVEGRLRDDYEGIAIEHLEAVKKRFTLSPWEKIGLAVPLATPFILGNAAERQPSGPSVEAIDKLIVTLERQNSAARELDAISKSQDELTKAIRDNTKAIRDAGNTAVPVVRVNSGMLD